MRINFNRGFCIVLTPRLFLVYNKYARCCVVGIGRRMWFYYPGNGWRRV